MIHPVAAPFPRRLRKEEFYPIAYHYMFLSRKLEEAIHELFLKGYVKGTVAQSTGNEATAVGMAMPFRPGKDVVSLLHRDLPAHLVLGLSTYGALCQYLANADSPTHGREGNVHHGDASRRRFPMMSHVGNMLAPVVGGVWAARTAGEHVMGLAAIGDGGASTGHFHESLNTASTRRVPLLCVVENNHYAFSTPTRLQYHCEKLSDRAAAYGIPGKTVDGTDAWKVYTAVCDAMESMSMTKLPYLLECMTLRLAGHAVYDQADYVSPEERKEWMKREPIVRARQELLQTCRLDEGAVQALEQAILGHVEETVREALETPRPSVVSSPCDVFAEAEVQRVDPFEATQVRNFNAVTLALDYILSRDPRAFVLGQDIGPYGSAFKTCKGLHDKYGPDRVMDMPISESATVGFALGATQVGGRPIVEFQFADFATEAATQLGLNCGTWYFRGGQSVPVVFRLPCGGGVTLGAFHSGEFEGLWARFPGLKILYPQTPQETFEALVAAYYDPNPCIVLENKFLYTRQKGDIRFTGDLAEVWKPRRYREGSDVTVVAFGAMINTAAEAVGRGPYSADIWNPFVLCPLCLDPLVGSVAKTGRLLVVQESGETAGLADRVVSVLVRKAFSALKAAPSIVSAPDQPVPFAPELEASYRPSAEKVSRALESLMREGR